MHCLSFHVEHQIDTSIVLTSRSPQQQVVLDRGEVGHSFLVTKFEAKIAKRVDVKTADYFVVLYMAPLKIRYVS